MAQRPEDLYLPNAAVARIIKDVLPAGINVGKEARTAISKAASVFVLYATSCANNNALKAKRKTISTNDVLSALDDMEFEEMIDPLKALLEAYRAAQSAKIKKKRPSASKGKPDSTEDTTENLEDDSADVEPSDNLNTENSDTENPIPDEPMEADADNDISEEEADE